MRIYNTSPISLLSEAPLKAATVNFLQQSYKDQLENLAIGMITQQGFTYATQSGYFISGSCDFNTPVCTIGTGSCIFNSEIFNFSGATISNGVGNIIYGSVSTTYDVSADPTTFSNYTPYYVHQIRTVNFYSTSGSVPSGCFQVLSSNFLLNYGNRDYVLQNSDYNATLGYTQSTYEPIKLRLTGTTVYLEGFLNNTTGESGLHVDQLAFTLPVGYRPNHTILRPIIGDITLGYAAAVVSPYVTITATGSVTINGSKGYFTNNEAYFNFSYQTT